MTENTSKHQIKPSQSPLLSLSGAQLSDQNLEQVTHRGTQHLGFKLDQDEFLLAMHHVREIIMLPKITYLPRTDEAVEGVFALRGEIMPALNLRKILGLSKNAEQPSTRVVIIHTDRGGLGIIVDDITEFCWLEEKNIESLDQNFFGARYHFLSGVSKIGSKMCGVLDVEKLMKRFPITEQVNEEGA
jgi:purine-binding chemotaxis protein CheW